MKRGQRTLLTVAIVSILAIAIVSVLFIDLSGRERSGGTIASFTAKNYNETDISLVNGSGRFTVVHLTQFEIPLCIGCEEFIIEQIKEIKRIADRNDPDIDIITLNIRKNPYSEEGWKMAVEDLNINISWGWIEEVSSYPISDRFLEYTVIDGGMANPTILILDDQLRVVDVTHVYSVAKGKIEGVQTAEAIQSKIATHSSGEDIGPGTGSGDTLTFGGMLALGVITSFSPCSIALLMAMVAYIGSMNEREGTQSTLRGRLFQGIGIGTAFTIGMALVFLLIGLLVSYIGEFVRLSPVFYLITGAVLIALGVNSIKPLSSILGNLRQLSRTDGDPLPQGNSAKKGGFVEGGRKMIHSIGKRSRYLAAFLLGILFSIGWAPCALALVFPVLVLIMTQNVSILTGGALMFVFGLGHGLVIIPFCAATGEMKGRIGNKYIKAGTWIKTGFGAVVIMLGLLFAARYFGYAIW